MVDKGEEPNEFGGYFIVKGNERLLRLLIMPRRNYVSYFQINSVFLAKAKR